MDSDDAEHVFPQVTESAFIARLAYELSGPDGQHTDAERSFAHCVLRAAGLKLNSSEGSYWLDRGDTGDAILRAYRDNGAWTVHEGY